MGMTSEFSLEIERQGDVAVIVVVGDVDLRTRDRLSTAASALLNEAPHVVVDLSRVTFLDSSGLSVLIAARQEANRLARDFGIRGARGPVARVLHVAGLAEWLAGDTVLSRPPTVD
jgi:anti-anti-sigma factor